MAVVPTSFPSTERATPRTSVQGQSAPKAAQTGEADEVMRLRAMVQTLTDLLIEGGLIDAQALAERIKGGSARSAGPAIPVAAATPSLPPPARPPMVKPSLAAVAAIEDMGAPPISLKPRGFLRSLFGKKSARGPAARLAAHGETEFTERVPRLDNLYAEAQRPTELCFPPTPDTHHDAASGAAVCERCWRKLPAGALGICNSCRA
jgi:hypothetical protein